MLVLLFISCVCRTVSSAEYYSPNFTASFRHVDVGQKPTYGQPVLYAEDAIDIMPEVQFYGSGRQMLNFALNSTFAVAKGLVFAGGDNVQELPVEIRATQSMRMNRTSVVCPSVQVVSESDWNAGSRLQVVLGMDNDMQDWEVTLNLENVVQVASQWKTESVMTRDGIVFKPAKDAVFHVVDWNKFDFTLEKKQFGRPIHVRNIDLAMTLNGQLVKCSSTYRQQVVAFDEVRELQSVNEGCSDLHMQSHAIGYYHICVVKETNKAQCWGYNNYQQTNAPQQLNFVQIVAYDHHTCGLTTDGKAKCWGSQYLEYDSFRFFTAVIPQTSFVSISAGGLHACGLSFTSKVECWGSNDFAQASAQPGTFSMVSAGYRHTCGISKTDRKIVCWGNCEQGECTPTEPNETYRRVSTGNKYTCGLTTLGKVHCWGQNLERRTEAPTDGTYIDVAASKGGYHSCAIKSDGNVVCWGRSSSFRNMPDVPENIVSISLGARHTCMSTATGQTYCFGVTNIVSGELVTLHDNYCPEDKAGSSSGSNQEEDDEDELIASMDDGDIFNSFIESRENATSFEIDPAALNISTYRFKKIVSAGKSYSCGTGTYRGVEIAKPYCWGNTALSGVTRLLPVGAVQFYVSHIHQFGCMLYASGHTMCFGTTVDSAGNFISGTYAAPQDSFVQIATKGMHSCGLKRNTKIRCWGYNHDGQCDVPDKNYLLVAAGGYHTCAITFEFAILCWGRNNNGQINVPSSSNNFRYLSAGYHHSCALSKDNNVLCWGDNEFGQATAPAGLKLIQVSCGRSHNCGIKEDWTIECWGSNTKSQLNAPSGYFSHVSSGADQTCATAVNGEAHCWGQGSSALPTAVNAKYTDYLEDDEIIALREGLAASQTGCHDLEWGVHFSTGICVAQNSQELIVSNMTCPETMSFHGAVDYCASHGTRLPTASEIFRGAILHSTCLNGPQMWTSTNCIDGDASGYFVGSATGNGITCVQGIENQGLARPICVADAEKHSCSKGHSCDQNCVEIGSGKAEHVCTCDDGFSLGEDGRSCFPKVNLLSPKTCKQLNWANSGGQHDVCANANTQNAQCSSLLSYFDAQTHCSDKGGRLPTYQEFLSGELSGVRCLDSQDAIWTSTGCSNGNLFGTISGNVYGRCSRPTEFARAVCVADEDIDECALGLHNCQQKCVNTQGSHTCICEPGHMLDEDASTCIPEVAVHSQLNCDALGWQSKLTNSVCLSSNVPAETCPGLLTYQEAYDFCSSKGARIPTASEVAANNKTSSCGFHSQIVWTTTSCSRDAMPTVGNLAIFGNNRNPSISAETTVCGGDIDKAYPFCVAEAEYDGCAMEGYSKCSHGCENIASGYMCTCPSGLEIKPSDGFNCATHDSNTSELSCQSLGWKLATNAELCATPRLGAGMDEHNPLFFTEDATCLDAMNFSLAFETCRQSGARLPHFREVLLGAGSGCGFDNQEIWTSKVCILPSAGNASTTGYVVSPGSKNSQIPLRCASAESDIRMRCFADKELDECTSSMHGCSDLCFNEDNGYACGCGSGAEIQANGKQCALSVSRLSSKSCTQLRWMKSSNSKVCATSRARSITRVYSWGTFNYEYTYTTCSGAVNFTMAESICHDAGGRLPTMEEVRAGVTATNRCYGDSEYIWTADDCHKFWRYSGGLAEYNGNLVTTQVNQTNTECFPGTSQLVKLAHVHCVADEALNMCDSGDHQCSNDQTCSPLGHSYSCHCKEGFNINSAGDCEPQISVASVSTCAELSWSTLAGMNMSVCGSSLVRENNGLNMESDLISSSNVALVCEYSKVTYKMAEEICAAIGARLPTISEVDNHEVQKTGCGNDYKRLWTSSTCRGGNGALGFMTSPGDTRYKYYQIPECKRAADKVARVSCVADVGLDRCATTNQCEHYCMSSSLGIACACRDGYKIAPDGTTCVVSMVEKSSTSCANLSTLDAWMPIENASEMCLNANRIFERTYNRYVRELVNGVYEWIQVPVVYKSCSGLQYFSTAVQLCETMGARLPTLEELDNDVAVDSGCGYNVRNIWTSTECSYANTNGTSIVSAGASSLAANSYSNYCSDSQSSKLAYVVCVADA